MLQSPSYVNISIKDTNDHSMLHLEMESDCAPSSAATISDHIAIAKKLVQGVGGAFSYVSGRVSALSFTLPLPTPLEPTTPTLSIPPPPAMTPTTEEPPAKRFKGSDGSNTNNANAHDEEHLDPMAEEEPDGGHEVGDDAFDSAEPLQDWFDSL